MKQVEMDRNLPNGGAPLAIIGIGCLFPQAEDKSAYWANIREGVDSITEIPPTHWRVADYHDQDPKTPDMTYGRRGGFLSPIDFNPMEFNIPPNTLEAIDTSQLLGLVAAGQALKDAGYGPEREYDRNRVSVILGVTGTLELVVPLGARLGHPRWRAALKDAGVDDAVAEDVVQRIADSYVPWQENSFPGLLGNVVAGRISKNYDLGGTNCVVDAACASSFSALHLAGMELTSGKSDMVVTGGVDTFNDIFMYMCFSKTPALSPTGNAKPFDTAGDGTILGEGLGIVVIKRLADAERDGDRIYAVIRGVGSSSDGRGEAIYTPSASGQKKAIMDACQRAGVTPGTIGLLEAHGTGTKVGDAVEVSALREIYGESEQPWCALGSVKSQIGHTKAAAGAAGLIKAALALHHKVIPPTIKVSKPLTEVTQGNTPFYLATEKRPWITSHGMPRRAAVSAFGFGGSNFHTILEEYRPDSKQAEWDGNIQILPFAAADKSGLATILEGIKADITWQELRLKAHELRQSFDNNAPCRLCLVVERNRTNLATLKGNTLAILATEANEWSTLDGAFFATGPTAGKLAMLFPGQGAQYTGMLRDLACAFPQVLNAITDAGDGFENANGKRLSDLIYPHSAFDRETAASQEEALRATDAAQPAIGAVSLGALRLLQAFGVEPEAAAGHSYGELTALCAAGMLDEASFHLLSRLRGKLMAAGDNDKGSMLAVSAPLAAVEQLVSEEKLDLVIANRNAPNQAVLSGSSAEIERALKACSERKLTCKQLPVAAAFHSRLVADAAQPLLKELDGITLGSARIPVYANTTAVPYPADADAAKALLANQLAKPVEFVADIEAMYSAGVRTFLEAGPGARLSGLVKSILGDRQHCAVAIDASNGKRSGIHDLARCLAQLAALGYGVKLVDWDAGYQPPLATAKKPAMVVPLCGANIFKPKAKRPPVPQKQQIATSAQQQPAHTSVPAAAAPLATQAASTAAPASRDALAESLRVTRDGMALLQKMQEETAQLHRRFLENQEIAGKTIQSLLLQQQQLLHEGIVTAPALLETGENQPSTINHQQSTINSQPAPVNQQPATVNQQPATDTITDTLLVVVSEKTGYPVEMLELEMGLDSDLGIDSIKRVEILSALQERLPSAPVIGPEHLGTLHTLGEIASFLGAGNREPSTINHQPTTDNRQPTIDTITETLLGVVSEKTGYPVEMLELEMGLDSDLGIDSIKRVEILSALQERLPSAPVIGPEHLGTLHTLGEIASFLGAGNQQPTTDNRQQTTDNRQPTTDNITETLLAVVSEKTGYPVEMLELGMGMDSDLGIDSIKRVEILSALQERLPQAPVIGPEHLGTLHTLGEIASFLGAGNREPETSKQQPTTDNQQPTTDNQQQTTNIHLNRSTIVPQQITATTAGITVADGCIWISDDGSALSTELCSLLNASGRRARVVRLDQEETQADEEVAGLVLIAPASGSDDAFLENAFSLLKSAAPALLKNADNGGALFATVSRLDGAFGCAKESAIVDPLSGGLAGLSKSASREWPNVACKAIDLGAFNDAAAAARSLADELFLAGPLEVGLSAEGRITLAQAELPELSAAEAAPLKAGDVVVVTGGGRGVTAAVSVALAKACQPLLVLLGRTPEPVEEPDWLASINDESAIKRAIMEHAPDKLHPKEIEKLYQTVAAGRELRNTLAEIKAAGGQALYHALDIRNQQAVEALLEKIRKEHGPVRGIVHGAGVLADRLIVDKTSEQFNRVYSTKVAGLRALLAATTGDDLKFIALFGSTTGRFGRSGQADYAVANEVLNKMAQAEARRRSDCRTVCVNWGPWDGGMVTPALKKVFGNEGIGLIPLKEGAELLVQEIGTIDEPVEVTVLAGPASGQTANTAPISPKQLDEAFRLNLTVADYPFIRSHVIDGKAVLPMAMIVEWLAHGALHGNPGFRFHGFNDLRTCKGVIFDSSSACSLQVMAGRAEKRDSLFLVPVELVSSTDAGQRTLHASAEIVLANRLPEGIRSIVDLPAAPYSHDESVYGDERLFHGPAMQGIEQVTSCSGKGITALVKAAPQPDQWLKQPLRSSWLTDPLVTDCAFQMMILWSFERHGAGSLPTFAGRFRQFQESFPREGAQVLIRVSSDRQHGATADMEFLDRSSGKLIARLEGYECVIDPSLARAFRRNQLPVQGTLDLEAA